MAFVMFVNVVSIAWTLDDRDIHMACGDAL